MAYGPFGLVRPALIGFVVGSGLFLIIRAMTNTELSPWSPADDLRIYATCSIGGILILLAVASIANLLIGNRIRETILLQRDLFANGQLPPAFPRPDVPGYDLQPRAPSAQTEPSSPERRTKIA